MRISSKLAAAGLALTLPLSTVAPATAASSKPTVRTSQLPTVNEIATAFPALSGGERDVFRATRESVNGLGHCGNWRTVLRAPTGRWASYSDASGNMPFFSGADDPGVFTYKYSSTKKARKGMNRLTAWLSRCGGEHDVEGFAWTIKAPSVARVGTQTVAMSELKVSPNVLTGQDITGSVHIAARAGRYLTIAILQADGRMPDVDKATQLAQVSLAAVR